jgi:hypothetical protein
MNHVEIHAHYLRQLVHENIVSLEYCRLDNQVANIFIKPLAEDRFIKLCMMLGLHEATIMGSVMMTQFHLMNLQRIVLMGGEGGGCWNINN